MDYRIIIYLICLTFRSGNGAPDLRSINQSCYALQRDINLAHFLPIRRSSLNMDRMLPECSKSEYSPFTQPADTEALRYAIAEINARSDLLPNISLGFVVLDSCSNSLNSLAMSLFLTPDQNDTNYYPDNELIRCGGLYKRFKNIIGTLGPGGSANSVMTVPLLSLFEIPALLTYATSDELSDKARFPYSLRLMPPNRFQAEAMIELLHYFNWTYASMLYSEGPYGENGGKQLQRHAKKYGICIAFTYMIPSIYSEEHVIEVVDKLVQNEKARVILSFLYNTRLHIIAQELIKRGLLGYFIWVTSDAAHLSTQQFAHVFNGAFQVTYHVSQNKDFYNYYNGLTPKDIENPWLRQIWTAEESCSWDGFNSNKTPCFEMPDKMKMPESSTTGIIMDGVSVYANALHNLIETHCPSAFVDKALLPNCIQGPLLLRYLKNTSLVGYLGPIHFDKNGDSLGYTYLSQYQHNSKKYTKGVIFDGFTRTLSVASEKLVWPFVPASPPDSVCSYPCGEKQYYIQRELPCCWECKACRDNEIIVNNHTACERCAAFTWPDEASAKHCVPINPTIIKWSEPASVFLITCVIFGGLICIGTGILFVKQKRAKIIKASSYQLMATILVGIMVALVTVFIFLLKARIWTCFLTRFGFNFSVSLIYGPLVVKTCRVYRIFTSGKHGNKTPAFIDNKAQFVMVLTLLGIQLGLCLFSVLIAYPEPIYRMPVETMKYVEVHCSLPLPALLPPLSFNILLCLCCAGFGFITHKLPENFNESWFIFVSVATTSFLWVVFLPAYFTAFYTLQQVILLACCLLINSLVTLVCLFLPKLYAVYFVNEATLSIKAAGSAVGSSIAATSVTAVAH